MALVSAILKRSFRLLKVTDAGESPAALDAQDAITSLNAMCTRWEANGLAVGWANVSAVDDTMPSPDEAEEAIVYQLALRLAGEYGANMSDDDKVLARQFLNELRRDRIVEMPLTQKSRLFGNGYYNITTDDYS